MKKTFLFLSTCLLLSSGIHSQVTIGSGQKPAAGALLDLKQDVTTTKGMMLPRVKLDDADKLKMGSNEILDTDNGGGQYKKHAGLWVYNISGAPIPKCAPIPDGLYIWNGAKWNGIGVTKVDLASLDVGTKTTFALPSGGDARPLIAQSFNVAWSPTNPLPYTNTAHATLGGISFTTNPLPTLATSPTTFSMTPNAMTIANPNLPWQSKESTLKFDVADECGGTVSKTLTLNQTNYALKVNNQFTNSQIIYTTPGIGTFAVQGNAAWTTVETDLNNILSTTTPTIGSTQGANRNDGTFVTLLPNFQYTTVAGNRYNVADITFTDTENPKRFNDITVSMLNCNTVGNDPSLNDWALRAGFTQIEINNVLSTGTDSRINTANSIQLHRDQSNNLFFSGDFGSTAGRWMITNLAATTYAKPHSQGRTLSFGHTQAFDLAYYAYPNLSGVSTATLYNKNKRLGLLYTWDAASGGKGGLTGKTGISGEDEPATPSITQGVCPNGWHLPTDMEWTELEQEINTNTSNYSAIADANGTITINAPSNWRGTTHGQGMKDACPSPGQTTHLNNGASNVISSSVPAGFSILLAGQAFIYNSNIGGFDYGVTAYLWSASGSSSTGAWSRYVIDSGSQVGRSSVSRYGQFSVRCKKN